MTGSAGYRLLSLRVPNFSLNNVFASAFLYPEKCDMWSSYIVVRTATSYGLDGTVSHPGRGKGFYDLKTAQNGSGVLPASCLMGTLILSRRSSGRGVKTITYLLLVPRSRIGGFVPLLPLYAFFACILFWIWYVT